jgi:ketohexokinase
MNTIELRQAVAEKLEAAAGKTSALAAFVGFDGFVDEILHVVDKRESADHFTRVPTIAKFAARLAAAAGRSTNAEMVRTLTKLGGNGPIMANALASFGLGVTYLGSVGYPSVHPVFAEFARRTHVHSIAEPGFTEALEFEDGKIMLGKVESLKDINWPNIEQRFGREKFAVEFGRATLVALVSWTMIPHMSSIWETLQRELCPALTGPRRKLFFDLADPEKRRPADIRRALELIAEFQKWFDVILGVNEKEAGEIGRVLGLETSDHSQEGLGRLALDIHRLVPVSTLVVHPVAWALATGGGAVVAVDGPFVAQPLITTGAGDHFNAGFCFGKLLGFDDTASLLCGVGTSGFYVRTAHSPNLGDLAGFLRSWK